MTAFPPKAIPVSTPSSSRIKFRCCREAFNFTDGTRPKCGDTDQDIYRIFMTGLDGTPMPSFADNIKPDEAWDLVFYLRTFMAQKSKEKEMAKQLGLKPVDPNAPAGQQ